MGMPTVMTQNGTGTTAVWTPDWMQAPFSVTIGAIATGTPTFNIEYTLDNLDLATATATNWLQSTISGTTVTCAGNLASPVRGIRGNIVTSSATAFVVFNFIQATFGR